MAGRGTINSKKNYTHDLDSKYPGEFVIGTLTDQDIKDYASRRKLISDNFDERFVKQVCYELRASNIYYLPIESDTKKEVLDGEEFILLRPHQLVVIITQETLDVPSDILGRILTKGSFFSLGINAVNTYVDPGFKGRLGIVFQNQTTQYLKIPVGQPIAKIEFSKLHAPVQEPYHGQHGYDTEIWPIRRDYFVDEKELKTKFHVSDPLDEIALLYGDPIDRVFKRVLKFERKMFMGLIIYFVITMLYLGVVFYFGQSNSGILTPLTSVIIGVISNFIFAFVSTFFSRK